MQGKTKPKKVELRLDPSDPEALEEVWQFNVDNLVEDARKRMGWLKFEDFCRDLLLFGFGKAADDPVAFVRALRDERDPVMMTKPRTDQRKVKVEEFRKAYA